MRKLCFFLLFTTIISFIQPIVVDGITYTIPQLVTDVLIDSPCAEVSNISWNNCDEGIGYFTNTNPNFPMTSGVVLTTGLLDDAAGPYAILTNNSSNCGNNSSVSTPLLSYIQDLGIDPDLISYKDISKLEFDFLPFTNSISFEFLFASDEYGVSQCQSSDAFALFLTNNDTNITTNLALVPGTNDPISVFTVRDDWYNSNCPSANEQYFGYYYQYVTSYITPINYEGATVKMTAQAAVEPNTPYHIEIIIGDRNNIYHNSAVFLEAASFNLGTMEITYPAGVGFLTDDMLVSNGLALCPDEERELICNLAPANYTFEWTYNGVVLTGETGSSIIATQPGNYCVEATYTGSTSCTLTDCITIEYLNEFSINPNPATYEICEDSSGSYIYDFNEHITEILGTGNNPSYFNVSYYLTALDAQNEINEIPSTYTTTSSSFQVFVRVESFIYTCPAFNSFTAQAIDCSVSVTQPQAIYICETNSSTQSFNLTQQSAIILNGLSPVDYTVTYHTSQAGANDGTYDMAVPFAAFENTTNPQTIYVRVEENDTGFIGLTSFEIGVAPPPNLTSISGVTPVCEGENVIFNLEGTPNATVDFSINGTTTTLQLDANGMATYTITSPANTQTLVVNEVYTAYCVATQNDSYTVVVNASPNPVLEDGILCVANNGTITRDFWLEAQGNFNGVYEFEWYRTSNSTAPITTTFTPEIAITEPGSYYVIATDVNTSCSTTSNVIQILAIQTATSIVAAANETFSSNATIAVSVFGTTGSLLYQLNEGVFQSENIFTGVPPGEHTITVKDAEGCTHLTTTIKILDYPKFFTPNGDGYNDTWNITGLNRKAKIYIFDRYGKLIKEISELNDFSDWDGTFNGKPLPASDYWFALQYEENGILKEFKAHFSLLR